MQGVSRVLAQLILLQWVCLTYGDAKEIIYDPLNMSSDELEKADKAVELAEEVAEAMEASQEAMKDPSKAQKARKEFDDVVDQVSSLNPSIATSKKEADAIKELKEMFQSASEVAKNPTPESYKAFKKEKQEAVDAVAKLSQSEGEEIEEKSEYIYCDKVKGEAIALLNHLSSLHDPKRAINKEAVVRLFISAMQNAATATKQQIGQAVPQYNEICRSLIEDAVRNGPQSEQLKVLKTYIHYLIVAAQNRQHQKIAHLLRYLKRLEEWYPVAELKMPTSV